MRFCFRGIPRRHAFINACRKISLEIFRKAEFYDNNGKDRHSRIHVLYLACKSNESLFPWREIVMSFFFLETLTVFAAWRLTPGLTDKSYINFQDVTSTLKNMRTALFLPVRVWEPYFGSSLTIVGVRWVNRTFTVTQLDQQSIGTASDEYESLLEPCRYLERRKWHSKKLNLASEKSDQKY